MPKLSTCCSTADRQRVGGNSSPADGIILTFSPESTAVRRPILICNLNSLLENIDHIFGLRVDFDRFLDVVTEIVDSSYLKFVNPG